MGEGLELRIEECVGFRYWNGEGDPITSVGDDLGGDAVGAEPGVDDGNGLRGGSNERFDL